MHIISNVPFDLLSFIPDSDDTDELGVQPQIPQVPKDLDSIAGQALVVLEITCDIPSQTIGEANLWTGEERVIRALSIFLNDKNSVLKPYVGLKNAVEAALVLLKAIRQTSLFDQMPAQLKLWHEFEVKKNEYLGDFMPFIVNINTYHAYGPCWTIDLAVNKEKAACEYTTAIHQKFDLVINLIEEALQSDPCYCPRYDFFKSIYNGTVSTDSESYTIYEDEPFLKQFIHLHTWKDGGTPSESCLSACFEIAEKVIEAQKNEKAIFVHCMAGWQRTSTFIVMCELLCHASVVKDMTNNQIQEFIKNTLGQIAYPVPSRFPSIRQIDFLLGDLFIDSIKEKCRILEPNCSLSGLKSNHFS